MKEINSNNSLNVSLDEVQGKDNENSINLIDFLPENMAGIVRDLESKLNYNPDFCILPMLVTSAGAIGNARKSHIAGYDVISVLFGANVGVPSSNKSQAFKFAIEPLKKNFDREFLRYREDLAEWKEQHNEWKNKSKAEREGEKEPIQPHKVFSYLNDATIEYVAKALEANPRGCFLQMDELKGFIVTFNRQQGSNAEQKILSLFDGTPIIDGRMGRELTYSGLNSLLSITGTIQPDVIHRTFKNSPQNGFVERFLFAYPDAEPLPWNQSATKEIKNEIQSKWGKIVGNLLSLDNGDADGTNSDAGFIPFSNSAKDLLIEWNGFNTKRQKEKPEVNAILGKFNIIVPRLALILQLIAESGSREISELNTDRAIKLGEYYILNALKVTNLIKHGSEKSEDITDVAKRELHSLLPDEFETKDATALAGEIGVSVPTIKRYLNDNDFFESAGHGKWRCKSIK